MASGEWLQLSGQWVLGSRKRHLWREAVVAWPYSDTVVGLLSPEAGVGTVQHWWTQAALERPGLWQCGVTVAFTLRSQAGEWHHGHATESCSHSYHRWQLMNWVSDSSLVSGCSQPDPEPCLCPGTPVAQVPEMFLPWSIPWGMLAKWEPPQVHRCPECPGLQQCHWHPSAAGRLGLVWAACSHSASRRGIVMERAAWGAAPVAV